MEFKSTFLSNRFPVDNFSHMILGNILMIITHSYFFQKSKASFYVADMRPTFCNSSKALQTNPVMEANIYIYVFMRVIYIWVCTYVHLSTMLPNVTFNRCLRSFLSNQSRAAKNCRTVKDDNEHFIFQLVVFNLIVRISGQLLLVENASSVKICYINCDNKSWKPGNNNPFLK